MARWRKAISRENKKRMRAAQQLSCSYRRRFFFFHLFLFFCSHCRCSPQMRLRVLDKRLFDNLTHGRTIRPSTIYMQSSLLAARRCHATHAGEAARRCRSGKRRRGGGDAASSRLSTVSLITCFFVFSVCFLSQGGSRGI